MYVVRNRILSIHKFLYVLLFQPLKMVNALVVQTTVVEKSVEALVDAGNLLVLDREAYEFDEKSKVFVLFHHSV